MAWLAMGLTLIVVVWGYFYQHHQKLVQIYHDGHHNQFTDLVEHIPHVSMLGVILLGIALFNFARFVRSMKKTPVRLPGSASATH